MTPDGCGQGSSYGAEHAGQRLEARKERSTLERLKVQAMAAVWHARRTTSSPSSPSASSEMGSHAPGATRRGRKGRAASGRRAWRRVYGDAGHGDT